MTGFEPLIAPAAGSLVNLIMDVTKSGGGKLVELFKDTQAVLRASKQYAGKYTERHGHLKVLGMRQPVSLESVYTTLKFLTEKDVRSLGTIQDLENDYRRRKRRGFVTFDTNRQDGALVAREKQFLMLLGGPGTGKSTFLRKMGLEALKEQQEKQKHGCIPVFIELKQFTSGEINIEQAISEEFRLCNFPSPEEFTSAALTEGKLLVLLDGLDEVPMNRMSEIIDKIQNFVDHYDKNRFITSCRQAAYLGNLRRFTDVTIAEFDNIQIEQFIHNWFQSELDQKLGTAKKCWELLQEPEYEAAKELAHTPLLLTLMCLVYDSSQDFPKNRSVLYRDALNVLLKEWTAEKRIERAPLYKDLSIALETIMLSEIAYAGFADDRLFLTEQELIGSMSTFLISNLNAPKHLDVEAILEAITIQQGILVERVKDVYSFSHLTFQEYLTAKYIYDRRETEIEPLITNNLTNPKWREVFLLVSGLMDGGADSFLLRMTKEAHKYISTPKLQALLCWAEQSTADSESNFIPTVKRITAIFLELSLARAHALSFNLSLERSVSIERALNLADQLDSSITKTGAFARALALSRPRAQTSMLNLKVCLELAIERNREFEKLKIFNNVNFTKLIAKLEALKTKIPDPNESLEIQRVFSDHLLQTLWNGLNIDPALVNLSAEETKGLEDYFYANLLIVQCKYAALRVSPKTWESIEKQMFTAVVESDEK
jgi:hypothetical protein